MRDHLEAEPADQPEVDRHVEGAASAGEVLVELAGDVVCAPTRPQDPRADDVGQAVEHRVVALAFERDAHHALVGRGDEERAAGSVDRPVGDVKEVVGVGLLGQPTPEGVDLTVGGSRELMRELFDDLTIGRGLDLHRASPLG